MKFSFFSFGWLTSSERKQKQEELELKKKELEIRERELLKSGNLKEACQQAEEAIKAYKSVRLLGNTCTVVLRDGTVLSKDDVSLLEKVTKALDETEIIDLFTKYDKIEVGEEEEEEKKLVVSNLGILEGHEDFDVKGEEVYLKGVNLAIPPIVLTSFIELVEKMENVWEEEKDGCISCEIDELEEQYEALKAFWLKLCLNGREQSRRDLLAFCKENDVRITKNGNLILYRNLVSTGKTDKKYTEFVSQQYFKIKGYKKSPKNYWIHLVGKDYKLLDNEISPQDGKTTSLGNLYDLYHSLSTQKGNTFTSWNNKGKYEIKIGEIYKIEDDEINLDNGICHGGGLHSAWVGYDYSSYGDTPVVVLVSPSKAITVPLSDRGKLRTTEMYVAAINDKPIGEHFSEKDLSAFDEEYNHLSIKELEESLKNKSFEAISVKDEISPLTSVDMENIKGMLKNRIIRI